MSLYADLTTSLLAELGLAAHIPHAGEKGGAVEHVLRQFLNRTLPERFEAASGFTFGVEEGPAAQSDVLIVDKLACTRLLRFQDVGLYPVDAVMARIEVTREQSGSKAGEDIERLVAFRKTRAHLRLEKDGKEWDVAPPAYLFAPFAKTKKPSTIAKWLLDAWSKHRDDRKYLPAAIVVPRSCIAFFVQDQPTSEGYAPWPDPEAATHVGVLRGDKPSGQDVTLGYWVDLMLAQFQVLLDRRLKAVGGPWMGLAAVTGVDPPAPPFLPTLLGYFPKEASEAIDASTEVFRLA